MDFQTKQNLFDYLKNNSQVLSNTALERAFQVADRKNFVPPELIDEAYEDYALPIGYEQTISQPTTVFFMLEKLEVLPGHEVLDVGSGTGWTTALLSYLVGTKGRVTGIERVPELVTLGKHNITSVGIKNAQIVPIGNIDWHQKSYDRILVSASARSVPGILKRLLKRSGIMVIPIDSSLLIIQKALDDTIMTHEFPGFEFVPLIPEIVV